jgi:1-deoxy-D-xylulose-5-phosphate synthase
MRLHGVTAFDLESGGPKSLPRGDTFTEAFGAGMCRLAERDERVVGISAAMCDGTGLTTFSQRFPDRFYDVGMAEEHAVTMAAGMAREGLRPVVAIYSTFMQRAYDQVMHDICLQRLPVVLALDRAGLVGEDGPTHHGIYDLSYLRMLPEMTLMAPATLDEVDVMLQVALRCDGPCAIRYPRGSADLASAGDLSEIPLGRAAVLRSGGDVGLIAVGAMVGRALEAAALLQKRGVQATVVNARFVKPLDTETLFDLARRLPVLVTLEENALAGGFGSAVRESLTARGIGTPVHALGIPDTFPGQGPRATLLARLGLSPEGIADTVMDRLALKMRVR